MITKRSLLGTLYGKNMLTIQASVVLPKNDKIVLFSATAVQEDMPQVHIASQLFRTAIDKDLITSRKVEMPKENLLKNARIAAYSGCVNDNEQPKFLVDGNTDTKWCDITSVPNFVDFDLGEMKVISGWKLVSAGKENQAWVTSDCFLQVRDDTKEDWRTVDNIRGNTWDIIARILPETVQARYIRLLVTRPIQDKEGSTTRIYEFGVY